MKNIESWKSVSNLNGVFQFVSILSGLLILLSSQTFAQINPKDVQNYVFMRNETSPRLTGHIIDVGNEKKITTLGEALALAKSGDCIRVGKGTFAMGGDRNRLFPRGGDVPTDIAIVGKGRGETELKFGRRGQIRTAVRWRISNVSINCNDSEVAYLR